MNSREKINRLTVCLEDLNHRQEIIKQDLDALKEEIRVLDSKFSASESETEPIDQDVVTPVPASISEPPPSVPTTPGPTLPVEKADKQKHSSDIEKFIGENLVNKIGIAITIIGVGVGAKYAIDHELISPLTRIILGYIIGAGLFGFSLKLKRHYHNFSAVLLSGALAIWYFMTFAAFDFYHLIPRPATFILMVAITIGAVCSAIFYNRQVIAHVGLVGAYAVPFLLDDGTGNVIVLFSYMTIINSGILIVSMNRYWKPILYSSFVVTWLIVVLWVIRDYQPELHLIGGMIFITIFFLVFYLILLGYKLLKKEIFALEDIMLMIANSGVFYGLGYAMLQMEPHCEKMLGLFTLANAAAHFAFYWLIFLRKPADRSLLYFVAGLAIVFITIAIPVQLNGRWVTLLWSGEAVLLFFLGRMRQTSAYEWLSLPLILLTCLSLVHDWLFLTRQYPPDQTGIWVSPVFNIDFLTSGFVVTSLAGITWLTRSKSWKSSLYNQEALVKVVSFAVPVLLVTMLYFSLLREISSTMYQYYTNSRIDLSHNTQVPHYIWNEDILRFRTILNLVYSMVFFSVLSYINIRIFRSSVLAAVSVLLDIIFLALFLTFGLISIGELRENYLQPLHQYYTIGIFHVCVRYLAILAGGITLFVIWLVQKQNLLNIDFRKEYDILLHVAILTILANELINWMDLMHAVNSYKLGLSIYFGLYSLVLVVIGIMSGKKLLRIGAMVLFGSTLIKLFVYDLDSIDTISKTIIFIALGILLLIISFLYNKYAGRISRELNSGYGDKTENAP